MTGSLNPADGWQALLSVPQLHYVGEHDKVIEPILTKSYQNRFPHEKKPEVIIIPGFDHFCCWVDAWPRLLMSP